MTTTSMQPRPTNEERDGQSIIEYGILLGTLALGVVLTLVAIGTQFRTVVSQTPAQNIGEP